MVRERSSTAHIGALDGLRGLAVAIVFLFHYGGGTHSSNAVVRGVGLLNKGGWCGVILFFVLSGFLITGILWDSFNEPRWWRNFYMRRSLRIFPLYFGTLVLVLLAAGWAGTLRDAVRDMWIPALFLQNMPGLLNRANNIASPLPLFHFWSLAVEEQFYLVWPFLLAAQKTRARAKMLCVAIFVGSLVFRFLIWGGAHAPAQYSLFLLTHAGALAAGGWLALCSRGPEWGRIVRLAPGAGAVGLMGFLVCGWASGNFETTGRYMMTWGLPLVTVFFASLLVLALRPGIVARSLAARWLRWVGGISFGIYVFHVLLAGLIGRIAEMLAGGRSPTTLLGVQFVVAAVVSVLAALISFHGFERPFLRLKGRFARVQARSTDE